MSKQESKKEKRDLEKHISSRQSQNKQAKDAAKEADLNKPQQLELHKQLSQAKSNGDALTFKEIKEIAKEIAKEIKKP